MESHHTLLVKKFKMCLQSFFAGNSFAPQTKLIPKMGKNFNASLMGIAMLFS
jgi:hypothetical protein